MAALLLVAAAVAVYVVYGRRPAQQASTASTPRPAAGSAPQALGGDAAPIVLPPLAETDPLVRDLVRKLSSHPRIIAWLATDGLIRNFTVVVTNVADGKKFAPMLRRLQPSSPFVVAQRNADTYVDAKSYERYTSLAAGVDGIDPQVSARLYATLKPRIEDAYRELGESDASFDRPLERAIVSLLQTPTNVDAIRVKPHGAVGYAYVDERLESMTPAQKLLLRMGPQNARVIQAKLHEIALALGIPASRLPASTGGRP